MLKVTHLVWDAVECSLCLKGTYENDKNVQKTKEPPTESRFCPELLVFLVTLKEISIPNVNLVTEDDQDSCDNYHYIVHSLPSSKHLTEYVHFCEEAGLTLSHFERGILNKLGVIIRLHHDGEQLLIKTYFYLVVLIYVIRIHKVIVHVEESCHGKKGVLRVPEYHETKRIGKHVILARCSYHRHWCKSQKYYVK